MKPRNRFKGLKIAFLLFFVMVAIGGYIGYTYYKMIFYPNVDLGGQATIYFHIPTGSEMKEVFQKLDEKGYVKRMKGVKWVAEKKNYSNHVHPGRYLLKDGMNNNELIDLLRSGEQEPVDVAFHGIRLKPELAGKITRNLEADSVEMLRLLKDQEFVGQFGFDTSDVLTMFIPNTYEFYWNTSAREVFDRIHEEFEKFWTEERKQKARLLNLSPKEVSILASIVQAEQSEHPDERPTVAGLYLNRLEKGMKLESDPTLVYAIGDFTIKRVLNKDRSVDSPYNTYRYKGLPPGPIQLPEVSSIKAVLNAEDHDYLFMCAQPDTTGYHNFAKTFRQHVIYAKKYRRWLNREGVLR